MKTQPGDITPMTPWGPDRLRSGPRSLETGKKEQAEKENEEMPGILSARCRTQSS